MNALPLPPHALGAQGREALRGLAGAHPLLAFDFDGTIAPIVDEPDAAFAPSEVAVALTRLSALAPVAVVTGRGVADAARRLGFAPQYLVGNHGMEGLPTGAGTPDLVAEAAVCRGWRDQLRAQGIGSEADTAVRVEDKTLSLSVHWRGAVDEAAASAAVEAAAARLSPTPRRIAGKCVLNLLPPGARDKGDALAWLAAFEGAGAVLFVGDDVTDELAFEHAPPGWITVRIGPFESTHARFRLDGQDEVAELVEALVRTLGRVV